VAAQQKQHAQSKRKYIASEAAPNSSFQAQLEASGGIVPVSSLAKNKLNFSGKQQPPAAANGTQHTRFDEAGNPIKAEPPAAAPAPAQGAGSNKSAAQLLKERLKAGASSSKAPEQQQEQEGVKEEVKQEQQLEGGQDSGGPVPEPVTKRVKLEGSQDEDGDKTMSDAVSPSAAAAVVPSTEGAEEQQAEAEGVDGMNAVANLPEDEVSRDWRTEIGVRELQSANLSRHRCRSAVLSDAWAALMVRPLLTVRIAVVHAACAASHHVYRRCLIMCTDDELPFFACAFTQFMAVVAGEPNVDDAEGDEMLDDDDEEPDTVEAAALKQLETQKITPRLLGPDGKPLTDADDVALSEFKEHIEDLIKGRTDRLEESAEAEEKIRLGEEGWKSRSVPDCL